MQNLISINEMVKKGWQLYSANIAKFLYPVLIMILPQVALFFINYFMVKPLVLLTLVISAISIIINLWMGIYLIELINKLYTNKYSVQENLYEASFRKIPSYFLISILVGLAVLGGFILLIVPGIIFAIWYCFAGYINVLETDNNKGLAAMRRSKELVVGKWGATFWRLVIPSLAVYVVAMIAVVLLTFLLAGGNMDLTLAKTSAIYNSLTTIVILFLAPLMSAFPIILYNSLKECKNTAPTATPTPTPNNQ